MFICCQAIQWFCFPCKSIHSLIRSVYCSLQGGKKRGRHLQTRMQKKFSSLFFFICMVNKMFWFCRTWKLNPQGAQRAHPRIMFDEERFLTHLLENNSAFPGEDRSGKVIEKLTFTWNCSSGENASTAKRCGCCVRHAHTYQSQSRKAVASVQRRKMGK